LNLCGSFGTAPDHRCCFGVIDAVLRRSAMPPQR